VSPQLATLLCLRLEVTTLENDTGKKRKRPARSVRIRKRLAKLQSELAYKTELISSLSEANKASAHAASLQASLSKQVLDLPLPSESPVEPTLPATFASCPSSCPLEFSEQENVPAPAITQQPPRYKKAWSDEESLDSDISLTGLPTVSFVGAAARLAQQQQKPPSPPSLFERIQSIETSLADRIQSTETSLIDRIQPTPIRSPEPFTPPSDYQDYEDWSYIGTPNDVPSETRETTPKEHNLYQDLRRRRGRRH
jgi:hypothetical protein